MPLCRKESGSLPLNRKPIRSLNGKVPSVADRTTLGNYINGFISTYNVDRQLSPKDYVLPIPLNEILGNPNVTQNEPYR